MLSGFMQGTILTIFVILAHTTKHVHCNNSSLDDGEDYVLTLTNDTFDDAVNNNKYLFVKFIAPWCGHCKTLAPTYDAVAKQLAESGSEIKLATVDATIEKDLATKHGLKAFPTLKLFRDGLIFDYKGDRTQADLLKWLEKHSGPAAKGLITVDELNTFKESNEVVVIGAFQDTDSDAANAFLQVALSLYDIPFGITSNKDIFKELNIDQDTVVLFKQFDEGRNDLTSSFDEKSIDEFVQVYQLPTVIEFNPKSAKKAFSGPIKIHVILFGSPDDDNYEKHQEELRKAAETFHGKVLFITVNSDQQENARLMDVFDFQKTDFPVIRLVDIQGEMKKYKPASSDITSDVITNFVNEFFDEKLSPYYRSQAIPDDWDKNPVKILVGKNFNDTIQDKTKTTLVAFVAPWCGYCKQLTPIYEELAQNYEDNPDVVIATIDATANEVEGFKVTSYPTIKLFPKDSDEILHYDGERTLEALSNFIDENTENNEETDDFSETAPNLHFDDDL